MHPQLLVVVSLLLHLSICEEKVKGLPQVKNSTFLITWSLEKKKIIASLTYTPSMYFHFFEGTTNKTVGFITISFLLLRVMFQVIIMAPKKTYFSIVTIPSTRPYCSDHSNHHRWLLKLTPPGKVSRKGKIGNEHEERQQTSSWSAWKHRSFLFISLLPNYY